METIEKEINGRLSTEYTYPMRITTIAMVAFIAILAWLIAPPEFTMYAVWAIFAGGMGFLAFAFVKAFYKIILQVAFLPVLLGYWIENIIIDNISRPAGFWWGLGITVIAALVLLLGIFDLVPFGTFWLLYLLVGGFVVGTWGWYTIHY